MKDWTTWILVIVLAALIVGKMFTEHHGPKLPWQYVPGYMAWIGLISTIVVVVLSKWLGKLFLQRPERPEDTDER